MLAEIFMLYLGKCNIRKKQRDIYLPTVECGGTGVISE
jgi:hypothetical protein